MDAIGLATLQAELVADSKVLIDAATLAPQRFGTGAAPELEACAYQLVRMYNAFEQMGVRVAKAFENHIDDEQGWHTELLRRLSLEIPGVRPAFIPESLVVDLQELRGFRHVVVHAYDLKLRTDKMRVVLEAAKRVSAESEQVIKNFFARVRSALDT